MAYLYPLPHDNKKSNKEENKTFIGDGSSKGRNRSEGWGMNDKEVWSVCVNDKVSGLKLSHCLPWGTPVFGIYTMTGWLVGSCNPSEKEYIKLGKANQATPDAFGASRSHSRWHQISQGHSWNVSVS